MLKQVQHDGRARYKILGVGIAIHPAKGLNTKGVASTAPFFVATGAAVHRRYRMFRPRCLRVYAPCQAKGLAGRTRLSREHS